MTASPQYRKPMDSFEMAALAANLAESKKAADTLVLYIGKVSPLADYFVICSGDSPAQIRTISDTIEAAFKQAGFSRVAAERDRSSRWNLLDYGDVIVHIMHRQERQYYQLETFWSHADTIPTEKWQDLRLQQPDAYTRHAS